MIKDEERKGLKLAIKGRMVALALLAVWFGVSRSPDPMRALEFLSVVGFFAFLGLAVVILL